MKKKYHCWLESSIAASDPVAIDVELSTELSDAQVEKILLSVVLEEAHIQWGYEEAEK